MAKPRKPTHMHLVEGTLNVTRHANRKDEPKPTGRPKKPTNLAPHELAVWDEYFAIAYWLTEADTEIFAVWCSMTATEVHRHVKMVEGAKTIVGGVASMDAARLAQWRMLGQELGLTPAARSKIQVGAALGKEAGKQKSDKFYA